jgi:hypothetical protein
MLSCITGESTPKPSVAPGREHTLIRHCVLSREKAIFTPGIQRYVLRQANKVNHWCFKRKQAIFLAATASKTKAAVFKLPEHLTMKNRAMLQNPCTTPKQESHIAFEVELYVS